MKNQMEVRRNEIKELEVFAKKAHAISLYKTTPGDEYGPELVEVEVLAGYELSKKADDIVKVISDMGDDKEMFLEICTYLTNSINSCVTKGGREVCNTGSYALYSYVLEMTDASNVINVFKQYVLDDNYQDNEELNKLILDVMMLITQTFEFFDSDKVISDFLITVNTAKTNLLRLAAIDKTYSK